MAQYEPSQAVDAISETAWLGAWAFAQVARTISGPVTRASVLSAFSNLNTFNVFGMLPAGFSTTKKFSFPGLTRLFNQDTVEGVVKNGQLVQTSTGYVPVFTK